MRPLRLMFEGFGSYRDETDVALHDVDFFVLTGPTGAGKSTVIDALCFALYGTVPRWGKGNVIRNALAPSVNEGKVCLVFEASGGRYAAVRLLRRSAQGNVQTKEARLDRLDPSVPPDADLTKILEAVAESVAEGDKVTGAVSELLGIGYEQFTQCVVLPQGRFAEFLQAKAGDRQDLLINLLAFAVYEDIGKKARERASVAASRLKDREKQLAELGMVTDEVVAAASERVDRLAGLVPAVDESVEKMAEVRARWAEANAATKIAREQLADLSGLRRPGDVVDLATRLADADELITRRVAEKAEAEEAETKVEAARAGLPEQAELVRWRDAHTRLATLTSRLERLSAAAAESDAAEKAAAAELVAAEQALADAETAQTTADRAHRAVALAADLVEGEPCPVCRQQVHDLPHHAVPADLGDARVAVKTAKSQVTAARKAHADTARAAATAKAEVEGGQRQSAELAAELRSAPPLAEVETALEKREAADAAAERARTRARAARRAVDDAQRERTALGDEEQRAWAALRASRDQFVALGVPPVEGADLAAAWQALLTWATTHRDELTARVDDLDRTERELAAEGTAARTAVATLLAEHDVPLPDRAKADVVLGTALEGARRDLADLTGKRSRSAALVEELAQAREEQRVAHLLGQLLKSNGFEAWLCAEALESLVTEASEILMQLSGGQYELHRDSRNDLVVLDHNDAGTTRPVNTLSGGETFQASLALALALSHQVVGLSGGKRDLSSMFLDEGFGTLDEATLDTVAATLERLAAETDRMVGIVTHVPALAERVPVQFAVTRDGASSRLRRVEV
ncbi:AAA family ATPase [Actinophytocola algeriensis]|uniref:Nuclease SbcCD subunit C n=1 Tax=Actinophytocola algeriensis TaxID=1768010 RepID=A0A7W7QAB8_9PSEU|nr:SMC family ATPase [Actinophytocola algeriensis]MBB4909909.1 exonuclease SbcC [Actinophytocola algeriensis]MBE1475899.1 exonuclease SbcC [Actinophytocola algeriensis]